jgi:hypothetical protein
MTEENDLAASSTDTSLTRTVNARTLVLSQVLRVNSSKYSCQHKDSLNVNGAPLAAATDKMNAVLKSSLATFSAVCLRTNGNHFLAQLFPFG